MLLETSCQLTFDVEMPTPLLIMLRPRSGAQQWISMEEYKLTPRVDVREFTDGYGNLCQRLVALPGRFEIFTRAHVLVSDHTDEAPGAEFVEIQNLPDTTLSYLLPSRFCESDRFGNMAREITQGQALGFDQIAAIENWLRQNIRFESNDNGLHVSAIDVNARQWGVCRDLTHLGIALCRSLSIPARMVVGYLLDLKPMDLHAWFEAYVGGRWYTFDATQPHKTAGYVAIGYGRDAADVAIYNQYGPALFPSIQTVSVEKLD